MAIEFFKTQEEWIAWQFLTPQERFSKSAEYLQQYLAMGGSLDPDYDPQSPFNNDYYPDGPPVDEPQYVYVSHSDDHDATGKEIDRDFALLGSLCADSDPDDKERLSQALHEARQQAKEQVRRHLGQS